MKKELNPVLKFDEFCVNAFERNLQRDGQDIPLPPKVFDLLLAMVTRPVRW